ncbi:hypothetical protein TrLO_g7924 [Triparma laevis f. longispina]|uniref:Uncharacterized protein n=1 Tax=Triparma laevis f. longispina TaxID=1714387 RepID=A0A9W7FUT7_9STRA|nr:hypothetical protein TrLO_g7924 [Triparma laevis f. longispina]
MPPIEDGDDIEIELPWQKDGHELIGSMILQVFGARKMVESRVVGFQDDEKHGVIMRCIQTCDGEWLDLPEEDVRDGVKKWETNKDLKALKNEITMAIEKIPTDVNVDDDSEMKAWLMSEVEPIVQIQESIEKLFASNPEVKKCIDLCKKQARINQRMKRDAESEQEELKRKSSFLGCM